MIKEWRPKGQTERTVAAKRAGRSWMGDFDEEIRPPKVGMASSLKRRHRRLSAVAECLRAEVGAWHPVTHRVQNELYKLETQQRWCK